VSKPDKPGHIGGHAALDLPGSSESAWLIQIPTNEAAAKLRISRVKALSNQDVVAVVTYLLARYPDTFPAMLDDALSLVSPKQGSGQEDAAGAWG
jgi:hypothetical protein